VTVRTAARQRAGSTWSAIVAAAADLFAERGFAAVSVQEIGEAVGITGGAIYRHFPSKDAVLHAVFLDTIEHWLVVAESETERVGRPSIARVVASSVQLVVDRPGPLATYVRERHRLDASMLGELTARERRLSELWSAAMLSALPELDRDDVRVRQQAVNGVLSSLARRPATLASPRVRTLITEGLVAVAVAPSAGAGHATTQPKPTWAPPTPRREQIIATAMRLFAERGYHGVSMDDIGEAVGMSGPSLYEHVAGKGDILLDAYDRAGALVVAGMANALAASNTSVDALDRLIRSYVDVAFGHVELLVVTRREGRALPATERPRLARRRRDMHEQWAAVLRDLRPELTPSDSRTLARSALALIEAVARQRRRDPSPETAVDLARAFLLGSAPEPTSITKEQAWATASSSSASA
jgi:AcrR family transcriptional regulator